MINNNELEDNSQLPLILVVDDREENLVAMEALFGESDKWQLKCVDSGEKALGCMLREDVSLVLLDVQMPNMDGYEVAHLMRGNPLTRHTPIIFISAIAHTQDSVLKGYSTGAMDFILKPFDPQILRHKIDNLLNIETSRRRLHKLNKQLEREQAFNSSILANAAEGIMVVNEQGIIQYANSLATKMLGANENVIKDSEFLHWIKLDDSKVSWRQSAFYQHLKTGEIYRNADISLHNADGSNLPIALSCAPLIKERVMVVIMRDMSVEYNLRTELEALVVTDPLTNLLNRRGFYLAVESALSRAKRNNKHLAIMYLDLDGFKRINDSLGHDAGDELLRTVARQLKDGMRAYDSIARMGGDEFTILLEDLENDSDCVQVAEKVMNLITVPYSIAGTDFTLSASIGIASFPDCADNIESLLRAADMAMYEAKRSGRAQYHFYSEQMTKRAHERLHLEQRLRSAIDAKQFTLFYQPQYYIESGKLRGFEALIRWPQTGKGVVMPDKFIPLLEETRLINPLGRWISEEGIKRLVELQKKFGDEVVLSLNISPIQFAQTDLAENLANLIQKYQVNPTQLEIEVTETALMQNITTTQEQLHLLRKLGVRVAVDDFGTGYSSLAYLRQFELDTLKIDYLFIRNMLSEMRDAAVVDTIISLGKHLNLEVIAEGVEQIEQRNWLFEHNCSIMQGWLAYKALEFKQALQVATQLDWSKLPITS